MVRPKRWGLAKPPAGATEVNAGHPLARDLRIAYLFNEGAGLRAVDAVAGHLGTFNAVTSDQWRSRTVFGPGLTLTGAVAVDWPNDARLRPGALPVTYAVGIQPLTGSATMAIANDNSSTGGSYRGTWVGLTSGIPNANFGDGGAPAANARRTKNGVTALGATKHYHLGFAIRGATDFTLSIDGRDDGGTHSGSGAGVSYTASNVGRVGRFNITGGQINPDFIVTYCYYWARNLRMDEFQWLVSEPYAFVSTVTRRRYFFGSPAGATPINVTDSLPVVLAELASIAVRNQVADSVAVALTEAARLAAASSVQDTLAVGLTEAARLTNAFQVVDTVAINLDEVGRPVVTVTTLDSAAVVLSELATLGVTAHGADSVAVVLAEAVALAVSIRARDDLAAGLADSPTLAAASQVADALGVRLDELVRIALVLDVADTLGIGLTELATIGNVARALDTVGIGLVEDVSLDVAVRVTEGLGLTLTEVEALLVRVGQFDALGVSLADLARVLVAIRDQDSLAVVLSDLGRVVIPLLAQDALAVALSELATITVVEVNVPGVGVTAIRLRSAILTTRGRTAETLPTWRHGIRSILPRPR